MQAQAAAQGMQPPGAEGAPPPEQTPGSREQRGMEREQVKEQGGQGGETGEEGMDLSRSLDQLVGLLSKSEAQLPPSKRRLLAQQRKTIKDALAAWEDDSKKLLEEVADITTKHLPRK